MCAKLRAVRKYRPFYINELSTYVFCSTSGAALALNITGTSPYDYRSCEI